MRLTRSRSCTSVYRKEMSSLTPNNGTTQSEITPLQESTEASNEHENENVISSPSKTIKGDTNDSEESSSCSDHGGSSKGNSNINCRKDENNSSPSSPTTPKQKKHMLLSTQKSRILPTPMFANNNRHIDFLQKTISSLQVLIKTQSHQINELVAETRIQSKLYARLVEKVTGTDRQAELQQHSQLQQLQKLREYESRDQKQKETISNQQIVINQLEIKIEAQSKSIDGSNKAAATYQQQISAYQQKLDEREQFLAQQVQDIMNYQQSKNLMQDKISEQQLEIENTHKLMEASNQTMHQFHIQNQLQARQQQQHLPIPPQPPIAPTKQNQYQQPTTQLTQSSYSAAVLNQQQPQQPVPSQQPLQHHQRIHNPQQQTPTSQYQPPTKSQHLDHARVSGPMKSRIITDSTCSRFRHRDVAACINEQQESVVINKYPNAEAKEMRHYATYFLEKDKPDNLIIVSGLNDLLHHKDRSTANCNEIANNVVEIGREAKRRGVWRICISGLVKPKYDNCRIKVDEINSIISDYCKKEGFVYIDQNNIGRHDMGDMIHVGQQGMQKLMDNILNNLHTYKPPSNQGRGDRG